MMKRLLSGVTAVGLAAGGLLVLLGGTAGAQTGGLAAFCQARLDAGAASTKIQSGDKTAQADFTAALQRVQQNAPAAVQADVATVVTAFTAQGPQKALQDPTVKAASDRTSAFVAANCGYPVVKVTATDYQFVGLPATIKAGPTVFQLTNTAPKENHEMVIVRRLPGVTDPALKIFALSDKKAAKKIDMPNAFGVNVLAPGATGLAIVPNLVPGNYIVACFQTQNGKKNGKPHYKLGMYAEFTVS
jgi:uncharacterized cupredoxin-like copper-binding protein